MKQLFFTVATIAIPGAILSWIVWLFVKGVYTVVTDWTLERELRQIRAESATRPPRSAAKPSGAGKPQDPSVELKAEPAVSFALDDSPPAQSERAGSSDDTNGGEPPPAV